MVSSYVSRRLTGKGIITSYAVNSTGINLDTTETAVALYVQVALLICFAFFTILLSTMLYKKGMKRFDGSVEKKYDNIQSLRL